MSVVAHHWERPRVGWISFVALSLMVATVLFLVLSPIFTLFVTSFQVGALGGAERFGFDNWIEPFRSPRLLQALWNTISLTVTRQLIALVIGIGIAWIIARSNLPGRGWLEFGFWIALFMPPLPVAMSWILLAGGRSGILNVLAHDYLPFSSQPLFNIYSWWGIVWLHLVTTTIPIKVLLLTPAFRNMDAALEESARTCGTGLFRTITRVVIPIMLPPIIVVMILGIIRSMQAFEVELVLGTPASIDVYSTIVYRAMRQEPPLYGMASALSLIFILLIVPLILLQQWASARSRVSAIRGRFSSRTQDLGRLRWPIFAVFILLLFFMTALPAAMLLVGSFMKIFGAFDLPQIWTTRHWSNAFSQPEIPQAFMNTLKLGIGASAIGMLVYTAIAYVLAKDRMVGRRAFEVLTWLPTMVPGIVLSLGLFQMFLQSPTLRVIYGTLWALILAVLIGNLTIGVQIIRATISQLGAELEEASSASGASPFQTFLRVVLPLITPSVIVVGLETFATAVSAVSVVVLLSTGASQPLSVLQLADLDAGQFEPATILGLLIMAISVLAAIIARVVSSRFGVARH
jgi:iron(III) transport system permease protein